MVNLLQQSTQSEFGDLVGISQQAVSDLMDRKVITQGVSLGVWIVEYCEHMRKIASGRMENGDADVARQRARLAKELADRLAMENADRRLEVAPVEAMNDVLAKVSARVCEILDSIPELVRGRIPSSNDDVLESVRVEIDKCRNMAASMSLSMLDDQEEDSDEDGGEVIIK